MAAGPGRTEHYDPQIAEVWAKDLYLQSEALTFWHSKEGPPGSSMPVIRRDELEGKGKGDTIRVDIALALVEEGLTGDGAGSLLEGNEERLQFRQSMVTIDQFQHAVRWTDLAQALITHDMRSTALQQLKKWLAGKLDNRMFAELTGNGGGTTIPTSGRWFGGNSASRNGVADTDAGGRLTTGDITRLKAYAQTELHMEPLRLADGEEVFGLVCHPYALLALKQHDPKWHEAMLNAMPPGPMNPLFTGAVGMWDGVILYSADRVPRSNNTAATPIPVADNVFFGAQAISRAYGFYPKWTEELFSYGQEAGIATRVLVGEKLNVFDLSAAGGATAANHTAIGSIVVHTSAVAPK